MDLLIFDKNSHFLFIAMVNVPAGTPQQKGVNTMKEWHTLMVLRAPSLQSADSGGHLPQSSRFFEDYFRCKSCDSMLLWSAHEGILMKGSFATKMK